MKEQSEVSEKSKKTRRKVVLILVEVLLLLTIIVGLLIWYFWDQVEYVAIENSEIIVNTELNEEQSAGYTTIAFFGLDNRTIGNFSSGNSDCIMIASINNETKEINLVSVYRDTLLKVTDERYSKANSAYQRGGVETAISMLNRNLDLNIDAYVTVDFFGLVEVVDSLGGIDIEVTSDELQFINAYVEETASVTGHAYTPVTYAGMQTLNGVQAVAYARIRGTAGNDFMRTVRQRLVVQAIIDKAQASNVVTLIDIANEIVDDIATSISLKDVMGLAANVQSYHVNSTTGFPIELTTAFLEDVSYVIPINLENNVKELHRYLYNDEEYETTRKVKEISNYIIEATGVDTGCADYYDLSQYLSLADPAWTETHPLETEE